MRRSAPLTALLILAAAVPVTADAAVRHVIRGAGFGHGIGMSQYGAYGYALEGARYPGILAHYYKGTQLSSAPSRPVRVLLQPVDPYIRVRGATSVGGRSIRPSRTYIAKRRGSGIVVTNARGRRVARFGSTVTFRGSDPLRLLGPALNYVSDGLYRGSIEVSLDGGGVTAINELDMDSYIRGVVAGEMPSARTLDRALGAPGAFRRLKVLRRGVSPRVVRARVVGTRGSRVVTGPQVRAALDLRDTWFTHYRVSSSASRARSARPASWGPPPPLRVLAGEPQ